jgi:hypothetical protein
VRDYSDCDLFRKDDLRKDMNQIESKLKKTIASSLLYSKDMDVCLKERRDVTLFSYINTDKYEKLGMTLRPPNFFKSFLDVDKNEFDRRVSDLVRLEIKKNKRLHMALSPTPKDISKPKEDSKKRKRSSETKGIVQKKLKK